MPSVSNKLIPSVHMAYPDFVTGISSTANKVAKKPPHKANSHSFEIAEEPGPGGHRLTRGDVRAQEFAVTFGVDPGGEQHGGFHRLSVFADCMVNGSQETHV